MYTYNIKLQDFASLAFKYNWRKAVFVFAEEHDLERLGTAPNITMQFSSFDNELPIILVITSEDLEPIYDNTVAPNTYMLTLSPRMLEEAKQTAWEYMYNYLKTFKQIDYALFAEWYTVISQAVGKDSYPLNMNKNPHFEWDKPKIDTDSSDWLNQMCVTAEQNCLCALGVDRRHSMDLIRITGHSLEPYPVQLVLYNFINLRKLGLGVQRTHATNYMIRDTVLTLQIMAEGGKVNTVPQFVVNAPSLMYTEEDIHTVLELPKKFKGVLN